MKRVLVTGAAGFIGRPVCRQLRAAGWDVIGTGRSEKPTDFDGDWTSSQLLDLFAVERLAHSARATHLLHLAWVTQPGVFWESAENADWLSASQHLVRAFAARGGKRVVIAGTCAEYDWTRPDPVAAPPRPATTYGKAKLALRDWCADFTREAGLSFAWGRVFFAFGPRENPLRLVPYAVNQLLRGEPILCGSGVAERDFLYVDDLARLFVTLATGESAGDFDLGLGRGMTIRELVERLATLAGRPDLPRFSARPDPPNEPTRLVARRLVTDPAIAADFPMPLEEALRRTLDWWRHHTR
jgi:nucleoside-diphosphate-sugar epimerase